MFKKSVLIMMILGVVGCSSWHDVKAPCTYHFRFGCGSSIPLQNPNYVPVTS